MSRIRRHLTYANLMSTLAVFIVLGGAAVAATQLPKNSVGGKQLRKSAVTSVKVKDGTLRAADFKSGQLPSGPAGPKGDPGPRGERGPKGDAGATNFVETLPADATIRGSYHIRDTVLAGTFPGTSISFGLQLASPPTPHYLKAGDSPIAACPGSAANPQAEPGHLCFYEVIAEDADAGTRCVFATSAVSSCGTAGRVGAGLQFDAVADGNFNVWGTWAVTAS